MNPRKKPVFWKQGAKYLKRVKKRWRRPRGRHSKLREKRKGKGKWPSVGYGAPKQLRGLHPSGFKEVLIRTPSELEKVNPEREAVRIARTVGKKKRKLIVEKAKGLNLKVLNA